MTYGRAKVCLRIVLCLLLSSTAFSSQEPSTLFNFHNGFWINLHHFLYAQALAQSSDHSRVGSSARIATANAPCANLTSAAEAAAWQDSVRFYGEHYASKDWLFDGELGHINTVLGKAGDDKHPPSELPSELRDQLERAAPFYRQACWPNHAKANAAWIEGLKPLLREHGGAIASRLAAAYETTWPSTPIDVDVVVYANWAGAYTNPPHITAGSVNHDYTGDSALEMIFHEASHTLVDHLADKIAAEFEKVHHEFPRQLDHAVIFFTAGFVTKTELKKSDPDYQPYAYRLGIYSRSPVWTGYEKVLRQYWQPYLEGKEKFDVALQQVAHAICCE